MSNPETLQTPAILIVDDEEMVLQAETLALQMAGIPNVHTCTDSTKVMELIAETPFSLVILDLEMPKLRGDELQKLLAEHHPATSIIMLTGVHDVETAVTCMKNGADDYITKPINPKRLITAVQNVLRGRETTEQAARLKDGLLNSTLEHPEAFDAIVTVNSAMANIFRYLDAIAPTRLPVLLCGETGVGKELFAKAIHQAAEREGEFVCVNCAGIDDHLFADTLFGHTKDAFTGAGSQRDGLITRSKGGTLFLDEIGDLSSESQIKLLRLLQEGTYYRLGSDIEEHSDARIIAATNVPLKDAQKNGSFRKDLFYRLQAHQVAIPPLRERKDDIPALVNYLMEAAAEEIKKRVPTYPPELIPLLKSYHFPGNIRELRGMIYDAIGRHQGRVLSCETFRRIIGNVRNSQSVSVDLRPISSGPLIFPDPLPTAKEVETALVREALNRAEGNKTLASTMLGMTRKTLRNKLPTEDAQDEQA